MLLFSKSFCLLQEKILMFGSPPRVLALALNMTTSISVVVNDVFDYFGGSIAWEQQMLRTCFNFLGLIQEITLG